MTDGRSTLSGFSALQSGHKNRASEVDRGLEDASEGYLAANRRFAQASRNIEAVQAGRDGWSENTIPAFGALTPEGQAAFRAGYADPLNAEASACAHVER